MISTATHVGQISPNLFMTFLILLSILVGCSPRQEVPEIKSQVVIVVDGLAYSERYYYNEEFDKTYAAAKALATADLLGSLIYVSTDSDEGNKGFYIVAGEKSIQKLGTVNSVGDISGDVENLKTAVGDESTGLVKDVKDLQDAVDAIEVPVTDVTVNGSSVLGEDGVAAIVIPEVDFTDVNNAIDGKVDKVDGYRLMSDAEGTKLANIAEGAQVNVIEKIKVNGVEQQVGDGKSVNVTVPTGALANLDEVAEENLATSLKNKVNAAAEGNHSHANKTVLDGITAEKVADWDAAEQNAKNYVDGLVASNDEVTAVCTEVFGA